MVQGHGTSLPGITWTWLCDIRGKHGDNCEVQRGSAVRKKPRFTHIRGNLGGDVSGKRFSTHVGEGIVAGVAQERLCDGTGGTVTEHPSRDTATWYRHRALSHATHHRVSAQGTATNLSHGSTSQRHINKDTPDDFSSGVSEERQLPTLPPGLAVPSAMTGLASLFGMGRGGSPSL